MRSLTGMVFLGSALAIIANAQSLQGAIVVYDFEGEPGNQVVTPARSYHAEVVPLDIARGPGLTRSSGANSFNSAHWHDASLGDYVSFGFTIAPGFKARLTELTFSSRSSNAGPSVLAVRSNSDGFVSNLKSWNQVGSSDARVVVDLSMLGDVLGTSEFRILSMSSNSAGGGLVGSSGTWRLGTTTTPGTSNLLTINGDVTALAAVPEPASWVLILTAASLAACIKALRVLCVFIWRTNTTLAEARRRRELQTYVSPIFPFFSSLRLRASARVRF